MSRALQSELKVDLVDLDSVQKGLKRILFFENDLDKSNWHSELINRMTIDIKDVRPRLFDRKLAYKINELSAFRHIFRYIYQSELDIKKLQDLNNRVPEIIEELKRCHSLFIETLQDIASAI